jgi:hypothetical protein
MKWQCSKCGKIFSETKITMMWAGPKERYDPNSYPVCKNCNNYTPPIHHPHEEHIKPKWWQAKK